MVHPDRDDRDPSALSSSVPEIEGTPRWVKILGASALLLIILFVYRHLADGGMANHGSSPEAPTTRGARP